MQTELDITVEKLLRENEKKLVSWIPSNNDSRIIVMTILRENKKIKSGYIELLSCDIIFRDEDNSHVMEIILPRIDIFKDYNVDESIKYFLSNYNLSHKQCMAILDSDEDLWHEIENDAMSSFKHRFNFEEYVQNVIKTYRVI